jgi:hypothetical protein
MRTLAGVSQTLVNPLEEESVKRKEVSKLKVTKHSFTELNS